MAVQFDCSNQQQEKTALKEKHYFHKGTANIATAGEQWENK